MINRPTIVFGLAVCIFGLPASGQAQQNPCFTPLPPPQRALAPGGATFSNPPPVTCEPPAPGKRVAVTADEYLGTHVFHTLYLPTDWVPGGSYPVIVEFAPNQTADFDGTVEDTQLGFYQSGGEGFIWVTMPFINYTTSPPRVATTWWGNGSVQDPIGEQLAAEYTKTNLIRILEEYGGDPSSVFLTGFSRGAIGVGYIGLRDQEMADIWLGFLPHSHHDGGSFTPDPGLERLGRIAGRASFITYGQQNLDGGSTNSVAGVAILNQLGFPVDAHELIGIPHTDGWIEDGASASSLAVRQELRDWLAETIANKQGTHSISGAVMDAGGQPIEGARIQSGDTHWTFSDQHGLYELAGLIDGLRPLSVSHPMFDFVDTERQVALAGEDLSNQMFIATTAVPEPATSCLLIGGLVAFARSRSCLGVGSRTCPMRARTLILFATASVTIAAQGAEPARVLHDFEQQSPAADAWQAEHLTARPQAGRLHLTLHDAGELPTLTFPVPDQLRDLSSYRFVAADITNLNDRPATFTFWALSGAGWGGMNSAALTERGREVLEPGQTKTLKIDLHGRYPGPDTLATAIDPAEVKQLRLVFEGRQGGYEFKLDNIRALGTAPDKTLGQAARLNVPEVVDDPPTAGVRARRKLPAYQHTDLTHVLYLPPDWQPSERFPVVVEYTGNQFFHKFCHSIGFCEQGHLAYGLARSGGYIGLTLPFVSEDGQREQANGWGSPERTIDYCLEAIRDVCENYGGDSSAVIITGFSRGRLACNYIALRDERIADVWLAFLADPDRGLPTDEKGWRGSGVGWNDRAERIRGRSCFLQLPELGPAHVDVQYLEESDATVTTRKWLNHIFHAKPGTRAIRGAVADKHGDPVVGVRVQSGLTHFTFTDESGGYCLAGLAGKSRRVTAAKPGYKFGPPQQQVELDQHDVSGVEFKAVRLLTPSD